MNSDQRQTKHPRKADRSAVNFSHRHKPGEGAGYKGLDGTTYIIERKLHFKNWDAVVAAEPDLVAEGNAENAILTSRGPNVTAPDNK